MSSISAVVLSPPHDDAEQTSTMTALETFDLFPKLPIELRLKIWKLSFPIGRHITFPFLKPANYILPPFEDRSEFPVTLRINHESRTETLKNYSVVFHGNSRKETAFVYSPTFDITWMDFFFGHNEPDTMDALVSKWQAKVPKHFSETKVLEVRHWDWHCGVFDSTRVGASVPIWIDGKGLHGDTETQMKPFLYFPGLETVKLVRCGDYHAYYLVSVHTLKPTQVTSLVERIRGWFEQHKNAFTKGAPTVIVED